MDGKASASVVLVDPAQAAAQRNASARKELSDAVEQPLKLQVATGVEFTVPYTLKVVCDDATFLRAKDILSHCLQACNAHLNHFNPESEVSQFNQLKEGVKHKMSEPFKTVLQASLKIFTTSGTLFDPACVQLAKQLRAQLESDTPPSEQLLKELRQAQTTYGTIRNLKFDFEAGTVEKVDARTQLDFGGINKGYAVDCVIENLLSANITNAFFEWGGDVKAIGHNHRREQWRVGLVQPPPLEQLSTTPLQRKDEDLVYLKVVRLENGEAIATSGDYENLWRSQQGTLYSTHYDSRNATFIAPSEKFAGQVSVKSTSCMIADGLATAALMKGEFAAIRGFLDTWRYQRHSVRDFAAYTRQDQLLAQMHHVSTESTEMRTNRIAGCLPARVVVVGGGLAGLSAAIEAARCGASVVLIEKTPKLGGNSAKATSGINGWGTVPQCNKDINDEGKYFERDTFVSGLGGHCDTGLVQMLSERSKEAIHWLMKEFHLPLTVISQLGGHSRPRTHRAPDLPDGTPVPIGFTIMKHLIHCVETELSSRIKVMTNTSVIRLLHQPARDLDHRATVRGLVYKQEGGTEVELLSDAVVLATGGFGNDHTENSLLNEFTPKIASMPTTNGPFATGDGMKMARAIGAQLIDMDKVQLHPTGLLNPADPGNATKYLGPEALRGSGGILLNQHGKRFVNELDLRAVVSKAIMDQENVFPGSNGSKVAYCVLNAPAVQLFGPNSLGFYRDKLKLFREVPDVEGLAGLINAPVDVVKQTLEEYYKISSAKSRCPQTDKTVFPCAIGLEGPFTVAIVTPSIHYTMGGVSITPSAEVLDAASSIGIGQSHRRTIAGLFGAGEVTGGVHGNNRLGGNSLLECVVFGRIAGDRAATILQKDPKALSNTEWATVVLREYREGHEYGQGSRVLRFNLPGSSQMSGLELGQYVGIRGEWDGRQLLGYYSPITLPHDPGVVGILARVDKGNLADWISSLKPGDAVYMKACGGLTITRDRPSKCFFLNGVRIDRIGLIAGGTGIAPMLQIIRAALKPPYCETIKSLNLVYAAEELSELTYRDILRKFETHNEGRFSSYFVLNKPPPGWTEGVGFLDAPILSKHMPRPHENHLIVICGPPVMQRVVIRLLQLQGHPKHMIRTVDEDSAPKSRL